MGRASRRGLLPVVQGSGEAALMRCCAPTHESRRCRGLSRAQSSSASRGVLGPLPRLMLWCRPPKLRILAGMSFLHHHLAA